MRREYTTWEVRLQRSVSLMIVSLLGLETVSAATDTASQKVEQSLMSWLILVSITSKQLNFPIMYGTFWLGTYLKLTNYHTPCHLHSPNYPSRHVN